MLVAAIAALTLAAGPEPVKLAAPGFTSVQMPEDVGRFYSEHFAQQLTLLGFRVTTAQQISALLGFERQKQLMACSEQSCAAELANALGVDGLITGQIGKFGSSYQINVNVIAARDGEVLASHSARVKSDDAVLDELESAAKEMAPIVAQKLGRAPPAAAQQQLPAPPSKVATPGPQPWVNPGRAGKAQGDLRGWTWISAGGGALCLAGSATALFFANRAASRLEQGTVSAPLSRSIADGYRSEGNAELLVGVGLGVVGAAALGTAGWMFFSSPAPAHLSLAAGPGAAVVTISGVLP